MYNANTKTHQYHDALTTLLSDNQTLLSPQSRQMLDHAHFVEGIAQDLPAYRLEALTLLQNSIYSDLALALRGESLWDKSSGDALLDNALNKQASVKASVETLCGIQRTIAELQTLLDAKPTQYAQREAIKSIKESLVPALHPQQIALSEEITNACTAQAEAINALLGAQPAIAAQPLLKDAAALATLAAEQARGLHAQCKQQLEASQIHSTQGIS
jgi:hypothetical protein